MESNIIVSFLLMWLSTPSHTGCDVISFVFVYSCPMPVTNSYEIFLLDGQQRTLYGE